MPSGGATEQPAAAPPLVGLKVGAYSRGAEPAPQGGAVMDGTDYPSYLLSPFTGTDNVRSEKCPVFLMRGGCALDGNRGEAEPAPVEGAGAIVRPQKFLCSDESGFEGSVARDDPSYRSELVHSAGEKPARTPPRAMGRDPHGSGAVTERHSVRTAAPNDRTPLPEACPGSLLNG